jgi:hypothetical protein
MIVLFFLNTLCYIRNDLFAIRNKKYNLKKTIIISFVFTPYMNNILKTLFFFLIVSKEEKQNLKFRL